MNRVKSIRQKITASLLAITISATIFPNIFENDTVYAATVKNQDNTCLGTTEIAPPEAPKGKDSAWSGSYVYFGNNDSKTIKFRVLAPGTTVYGEKTLFLDSNDTLFTDYFDNTDPFSGSWTDSDIRAKLNGDFLDSFTSSELAAIANSTRGTHPLEAGDTAGKVDSFTQGLFVDYVPLTGEKVFLLDAEDASNTAYGYSATHESASSRVKGGSSVYWWLRSAPGDSYNYAGAVSSNGFLSNTLCHGICGVAPALNIKQSDILFSTAVNGNMGETGTEYKLTIIDDSIDFELDSNRMTTISGTKVTVPCSGSGITRKSVLVLDKEYGTEGATIKYYGELDSDDSFDLADAGLEMSGWNTEYFVYLVGEKINGDQQTDYASEPIRHWGPARFMMIFKSNGVGTAPKTQYVFRGEKFTKPEDPTALGYVFEGWYKEAACENAYDFDSEVSGHITVYAKWTKSNEPFSFTTQPLSGTAKKTEDYTFTWALNDTPDTISVYYWIPSDNIWGASVSLAGQEFSSIKYSDSYADGNVSIFIIAATKDGSTIYSNEFTVTWLDAAKNFTVSFNTNGHGTAPSSQTIKDGKTAVMPSDLMEDGWIFNGWYKEASCTNVFNFSTPITEDITLYAKWNRIKIGIPSYTVTFNTNSEIRLAEQIVADGENATEPAPLRDGWFLEGWYTDDACTKAFDFSTPITRDITLNAKWVKIKIAPPDHTVSFDTGCDIRYANQIVTDGNKATDPGVPTRNGYSFDGWYQDSGFKVAFDFNTAITADTTLYAKWKVSTVVTPTLTTKPGATVTPKVTATPKPTAVPSTSPDSKDQIREFVDRIYKYVLDREPEEEGANFWTDELYSFRRTGGEVGLGFIFSDEFTNRNLSNDDFVTVLYKTFFGRDPEPEGFAFWTGSLNDGTLDRFTVASGFVYSQEWADTCAKYGIRSGGEIKPSVEIEPTDATYAFVERMYTTAMKRASDPEGAKFWANELANFRFTGEQVGVMFFLSDEMNSFGLDNKEFVTRLYKTFMDRDPEQGGFDFWVKYLDDGGTRESVVLGFTRSEEFVNKCIEARILPY